MTSTISPPQPPGGPPPGSRPPYEAQPTTPQSPGPRAPRGTRSIPTRTLLADVAGLGSLGALALFGFDNAYGGTRYFLAGVVGLVAGIAVAWFAARWRLGTLATVGLAVGAYFLVGGVVVAPEHTVAGFVPTPDSLYALADGAVAGWARLLTSLPPVGEADNLLAVPFLSGLLCGLLSLTVSLRSRRPLLALVFPAAVLALGILFGTPEPAGPLLQGAVFAVVSLGWASYRYQTRRRIDTGRRRSTRWIGVVAMLGLAGVLAATFGGDIPGTGRPRVVLRDDVDPPFDPSDYPSPLAGYRRFTNGPNDMNEADAGRPESEGWRHTELFTVRGLPADEPLRLATLDTYSDGVVYEVGTGSGSSGYFQRVGTSVSPDIEGDRGEELSVEIEVLEGKELPNAAQAQDDDADPPAARPYSDIWLPLPENPTSVEFDAGDQDRNGELAESLRLNVRTGAAAVPVGLSAGDRYTVTFRDVDHPDVEQLEGASVGDATLPKPYTVAAVTADDRYTSGPMADCEVPGAGSGGADEATGNPLLRVAYLGRNLQGCGGLDDGRQGQGGHGAARLAQMIPAVQGAMVGNGEQFASLAALMADSIGVDARVVMGFRPQDDSDEWREANPDAGLKASSDGTYRVAGNDIDAWIEVNVEGHGWVPIDVTPDKAEPESLPQPQSVAPQNEPPPPPPSIPPSDEDEAETDNTQSENKCDENPDLPECDDDEGGIPWGTILKWASVPLAPILVVALITGFIAWLKARRRNHRRNDGPPDARVKGGWDEITDLACDLGSPVPPRVTRREAAALIANRDATHLARHADGAVFGPYDLADGDVERYWDEVDSVRSSMLSDLSRFGRWKVLVSLSSLRLSAQRNRAARRARRGHGGTTPTQRPPKRPGGGPNRAGTGAVDELLPGASPHVTPELGGGLR